MGRRPPRVRDDTIVAVATATGRSAVAIVRVSGADAECICRRVLSPWPLRAREATRCRVHAARDESVLLDEGIVTVFAAPRSYTGETVVEIGVHGGVFVPQAVCAALVEAGARPALPGEFTERAVLRGKLDLVRAEGIADLIDARSRATHRMALQLASGALSVQFAALRSALLDLEALLAYEIDFPEEDSGRLPRGRAVELCSGVITRLDALLATAPAAQLGQEGATIVLAGPPNAGKSSLLNALVGETRAIVSDLPGTTRDAIEVLLEHDPWPLRLVDTAGLRDGAGEIERLGIEVSERYLARAHVVVACAVTPAALRHTVAGIRARTAAPIIGALTKGDLLTFDEGTDESTLESDAGFPFVVVSALRGDGLQTLLANVTEAVVAGTGVADLDTPMVTRARHRGGLLQARTELAEFCEAWLGEALPPPIAAVHVRAASRALNDLIGAVDAEDVFERVFSTFCIGK